MPSNSTLRNCLGAALALGLGCGLVVLKNHWSKPATAAAPKPAPLKKVDPKRFTKPLRNPEVQLRKELQEALGYVPDVGEDKRLLLLRSLGSDLAPEETDALLSALVGDRPQGTDLAWFSSYLHEIARVLQKQPQGYDLFARGLATLAGDPAREPVIRDYAMQHLRVLWSNSGELPELRGAIQSSLWELAKPNSPVAASALLSLHELGSVRRGDGQPAGFVVPSDEIEPLLTSTLKLPPSQDTIPLKMTATRAAGERGLDAFRPELARLAGGSEEHVMVRMSAINALGRIGDPADRPLFNQLRQSPEPRIASAARSALAAADSVH